VSRGKRRHKRPAPSPEPIAPRGAPPRRRAFGWPHFNPYAWNGDTLIDTRDGAAVATAQEFGLAIPEIEAGDLGDRARAALGKG
jgi:hypothetical protein